MKNYVLRYMPLLYKDNTEMVALYGAEKNIYIELDNVRRTLYNNMYINSANLDAIKKYEKTYEIMPDSSLTLEQRRQIIINKLMFRPPFTRQRIEAILDSYYGNGNYALIVYPTTYTILIDPDIEDWSVYYTVLNLLRQLIPSNMVLLYGMPYTYIYLRRNHTYESMQEFTYGDLSQYVDAMNTLSDVV